MRPTRRAVLLAPVALALPQTVAAPVALAVPRGAAVQPADPLDALLADEHAAVHLYGILAPRLPESLRAAARAAYDDHRRHRDQLVAAVTAAGRDPEPPRLSYALPSPVPTPAAARALAVRIEDSLALRWHALVGEVAPRDRAAVATALADEAEHLVRYRWSAGVPPAQAAPPFPGR